MSGRQDTGVVTKDQAMAEWHAMWRDEAALLAKPGAHHKVLLRQAYTLHQDQIISGDDLSDLLELADGALAFAVEALLDSDRGE